ncbi:N-acetylglucosamine-specific PTS transporter subunit IIBC [Weissella confusa]|uniref:N-acetylglucosamine-specific PTS transporter subunit IIBC n=1 Tax=Weissella confusa TaxID=1583 RepID=UPI0018F20065|nr:N-acetylglucosamine-specific PTS transporter subunit IIBC [Weissella confusa]MBJ7618352.1 PTS transporter subunit EIIC [Weissella confusa]
MKDYLQRMGRSLMLPVSVLPAAALLVGIGNWIMRIDGTVAQSIGNFLAIAGNGVLGQLALLFAVGLALGMVQKKEAGAVALAAVVAYELPVFLLAPAQIATLTNVKVAHVNPAFEALVNNNVLLGIVAGLVAAALYNRFSEVRLPTALAFFSGKRSVPIISAVAMLVISVALLFVWPPVYTGLVTFAKFISGLGWVGAGLYGFFNRMLIPTGLHHALNSVFWFNIAGINDIGNYWASTGTKGITGMYQAGFFPVMMFGLPAGAFAIYRQARPAQKKRVGSLMLAAGIAAFFTGVTEPLEFSFMFVTWPLYVIHAILMGLSLAIAAFFHWTSGFTFSGGLVDYVLSFSMPLANKPYMLLVQGLVFAVLYYAIFTFAIKKFNLMTPGRDPKDDDDAANNVQVGKAATVGGEDKYLRTARMVWSALGGDASAKENLTYLYNCTTRLRYKMTDTSLADVDALKKTPGVMGVNVLDDHQIHIVIGPDVQFVADNVEKIYNGEISSKLENPLSAEEAKPVDDTPAGKEENFFAVANGSLLHLEHVQDETFASKMMGDGFAIEPSDNNITAPLDAEVTMVAPTKHAIGLRTESGLEVLVHMGINTVEMNGEPFDVKVSVGDKVKHGDLLATMDIEAVKAAGKLATTMVIFMGLAENAEVKVDDEDIFDGIGGNYVGRVIF